MKNSSCPLLVVSSCQAGRLCSPAVPGVICNSENMQQGSLRNWRRSWAQHARTQQCQADATRRDAAVAGPWEFSWDDFDDLLGISVKLWDYYIHYYYVFYRITTYYYIYYYDDCDSLGTYPQIAIFMGKVKTNPVDVEVNDSIIFKSGRCIHQAWPCKAEDGCRSPGNLSSSRFKSKTGAANCQMIHDACLVVYVCGVVSKFLIAQMKWCIIILAHHTHHLRGTPQFWSEPIKIIVWVISFLWHEIPTISIDVYTDVYC